MQSVWISANAGSGKTTALTARVVQLMLLGAAPERICCITYTKAAASEMRTRILGYIRKNLMLADDATRAAHIEELIGATATPEMITRAQGLFGAVLDSAGGGPQITTIHGFCQTLLKRFPLEAGLSPHFTVLDDASAANILRRARARVLQSGEGELGEALALMGNRMGEERFSDHLKAIAAQRAKWDEIWRGQTPTALRARIEQLHGVEGESHASLEAALLSQPRGNIVRDALPDILNAKPKEGAILAQWLAGSAATRTDAIEDFCKIFWAESSQAIRATIFSKKLMPVGSAFHMAVMEIAQAVETYMQKTAALSCAEESYAMALVARALNQHYARLKIERQALDYDDLITATLKLVANPAMLGWVMEKLDHRIDHLLIDEAQDTSAAQWGIARVLVEELIANGGIGSGGLPRTVLVVGDEKQSIYSFQGAAPELFQHKKVEFNDLLLGSEAPLKTDALTTSYRSSASVLQLVDAVATLSHVAPALGADLSAHQLHHAQLAGKAVLHPAIAAPEKPTLPPLTLPTDYPVRESGAELLAQAMLAEVQAQLNAGRSAGDILILVQRRRPLVLPLIRALQRAAIPVAGLDRLVLARHLAVRDMLALIACCLNTGDDLATAQVLRSPLIGLSEEELLLLAHGRKGTLWAAANHTELKRWRAARASVPYDFLTLVLEQSAARTRFAERFGDEVQEVLDELKQQAVLMPPELPHTLAHFADWLAGSVREIKREVEGAGDAVRIMTVHGAKGLEAPVVLVADLGNQPSTKDEKHFFSQSAAGQLLPVLSLSGEAKNAPALVAAKERKKQALVAEYQRLLYVALTRPQAELHLFGLGNKKGMMGEGSWHETVRAALVTLGAREEAGKLIHENTGAALVPHAPALKERAALPAWLTNEVRAEEARGITAPSRLGEGQEGTRSEYAGERTDSRARGVRMHQLLELLGAQFDANYLTQLIDHFASDWDDAEKQSAQREIAALYAAHPWVWQNPSYAEVNIAGSILRGAETYPASGQIDRLVKLGEGWVILDYKTGKHIPPDAMEAPLSYRLQLKTYQALVVQLYPGAPVRTAILWTHRCQLMWMDEAVAATPYEDVMFISPVAA